jgi:hypothetical protein
MKGFSSTNLKYIKRFYQFYIQDLSIGQQAVGQISHQVGDQLQAADNKDILIRPQVADELGTHPIFQVPWGHHREIITKCKSVQEALFYVQKTIKNGWSRAVLVNFFRIIHRRYQPPTEERKRQPYNRNDYLQRQRQRGSAVFFRK